MMAATVPVIDYQTLDQREWADLYEALILLRTERDKFEKVLQVEQAHKSAMLGISGSGEEFYQALSGWIRDSRQGIRRFASHVTPWAGIVEETEEEEAIRLLGDTEAMQEAWIAEYEPENLEAYRKARKERIEAMKKAERGK